MASKPIESLFSNSPCTKIKMRCGPAIAVASQSAVRLGCEAELAHPIAHTRNLLLRIQSDLNQRQLSVERRALVQNPAIQRAVVGLSALEAEDHRQNTILSRPGIYKGELEPAFASTTKSNSVASCEKARRTSAIHWPGGSVMKGPYIRNRRRPVISIAPSGGFPSSVKKRSR